MEHSPYHELCSEEDERASFLADSAIVFTIVMYDKNPLLNHEGPTHIDLIFTVPVWIAMNLRV